MIATPGSIYIYYRVIISRFMLVISDSRWHIMLGHVGARGGSCANDCINNNNDTVTITSSLKAK